MLWLKSWLETRFSMLAMFGFLLFVLGSAYARGVHSEFVAARLIDGLAMFWLVPAVMLAGDGIKTQPALQATKGLHGSAFFTLSLPVSRFRLLAIRACLGLIETAGVILVGCCALWVAFPAVRMNATSADLFRYAAATLACASEFYFLSVFLATFLDDIWRIYGSIAMIALLWCLSALLPSPFNVFRAMGEASPLITHALPWTAMGVSIAFAALLFLAAMKVAQLREY
jgi:hypothetical protein